MSLDTVITVNLEETAADGNLNQITVPRNQLVRPIYEEQLAANGHRRTFCLPGESSCSKWVNRNSSREDVNPESGKGRSKNPGILHLRDWHTSVIFFGKEEAGLVED